jgi:protein-disulfide isomerase
VAPFASRFATGSQAGGWWRRRAAARGIVGAGLVLAVAGGTWATVRMPAPVTSVDDVRARDPKFHRWYTSLPERPIANLVAPDCPRQGPAAAAITIVEFSDFQCPFCEQAFRDLRELLRANPDVSLTFRHFPLDATCNSHVVRSLHPDACLAACAAECANRQGRFWEYHDALFENHDSLERESLFRYARETRLDLAAFRTGLDDPTTRARVGADIEAARQVGVESTPTLFINGRTLSGALERPYYDYALVIERHRQAHAAGGAS